MQSIVLGLCHRFGVDTTRFFPDPPEVEKSPLDRMNKAVLDNVAICLYGGFSASRQIKDPIFRFNELDILDQFAQNLGENTRIDLQLGSRLFKLEEINGGVKIAHMSMEVTFPDCDLKKLHSCLLIEVISNPSLFTQSHIDHALNHFFNDEKDVYQELNKKVARYIFDSEPTQHSHIYEATAYVYILQHHNDYTIQNVFDAAREILRDEKHYHPETAQLAKLCFFQTGISKTIEHTKSTDQKMRQLAEEIFSNKQNYPISAYRNASIYCFVYGLGDRAEVINAIVDDIVENCQYYPDRIIAEVANIVIQQDRRFFDEALWGNNYFVSLYESSGNLAILEEYSIGLHSAINAKPGTDDFWRDHNFYGAVRNNQNLGLYLIQHRNHFVVTYFRELHAKAKAQPTTNSNTISTSNDELG